jgi:hypothetical protein
LIKEFHAFKGFDYADLQIDHTSKVTTPDSPLIYNFRSKQSLKYFKINGYKSVSDSEIPGGKLLLSITYELNSTSDAKSVYNSREIYQLDDKIFIYLETGFAEFYGQEINKSKAKIQHLEGLVINEPIEKILNSFTLWLVEVDPIGFELLRRMNRDGFAAELSVDEDLMHLHVSDNLMDSWFHKMTDFADSIALDIKLCIKDPGFMWALKSAVEDADSHTRSDFFQSQLREEWVNPWERSPVEDD